MKNFKDNFTEILREKNISISKLAKELNLNYSTVSNWTKGKSRPNLFNVVKLCRYLKIHSKQLLGF